MMSGPERKVFVGGMWHETNTFSPIPADVAQFEAYQCIPGYKLRLQLAYSQTEIGGFLREAWKTGIDAVPSGFYGAVPSGPVTMAAYEKFSGILLSDIDAAAESLEGIYLPLHGAMVLENGHSGDALLLRAVKERWPHLPLVATFDIHANLSDEAIESADLLIGYDTFPHVDMAGRGAEAARLMARMLSTGARPKKAWARLPLITVPQAQSTDDEPMAGLLRLAHDAEEKEVLWTCSVVPGFAYADSPHLGFMVLGYGDDSVAAAGIVRKIAETAWNEREAFVPVLDSEEVALARIRALADTPGLIVLAEPADNVGGGGPGDSTHVLAMLLKENIGPATVVLWDPLAAAKAAEQGIGSSFAQFVGAHSTSLSGSPVFLEGTVSDCRDITYQRSGPYMTGQTVRMGVTAVVQAGLVTVALTTERVMPFDSDHITVLGIDPKAQRFIVAKSGSAWRVAFEHLSIASIYVDTPGVAASNVTRLPYVNLRGPMFPLNKDIEFEVVVQTRPWNMNQPIQSASTLERFLPADGYAGTLVARIWQPGNDAGPCVVAIREDGVYDISNAFPTMSSLLETESPAQSACSAAGLKVGGLAEIVANSTAAHRDPSKPFFLAPCDLQVVKASGVTFAESLIERLIEEHGAGDPILAARFRDQVLALVGSELDGLKPGSEEAMKLKSLLMEKGMWSQYLEVGIGPDAEVFTKAPVLAAVGYGDYVGIREDSVWNNPEPEVVLAVNSRARIVGATLGNDVNHRDIEGRSALLLGKAKDNNATCSVGPFIRLFDESYDLDHVRQEQVQMTVAGLDGFVLEGSSSLEKISRDPLELVAQTMSSHQYPDGVLLFLGTMFAPTKDRGEKGKGFTHHVGDHVSIRAKWLGELVNEVKHCKDATPWTFGVRALVNNLSARGLLNNGI
jgi:fumarylacetoacetate (FAA) hydrolase family protein/microcystin degradation protein MlrC